MKPMEAFAKEETGKQHTEVPLPEGEGFRVRAS
jgi:hypothetical protein